MHALLPPEQGEFMSQFFQVHPENPQARLIKQAVEIIRGGGVVVGGVGWRGRVAGVVAISHARG